jgi:hypothetical protein
MTREPAGGGREGCSMHPSTFGIVPDHHSAGDLQAATGFGIAG